MVKRPLHYKRMITRRKLHVSYAVMSCFVVVHTVAAVIFLRNDFKPSQMCVTTNVLNNAALYSMVLFYFGIVASVMTMSYVLIVVELRNRKRKMKEFRNNTVPNAADMDSKVTRAIIITLGTYMASCIPSTVATCLVLFVEIPYMVIILDVTVSCIFINTIVNPFIYYKKLKDFRQGYRNILLCKTTKVNQNQQIEVAVI